MLIIRKEIIDFLFVKTRKKKEKLLSNIKVTRNSFLKNTGSMKCGFSHFFIFVIFYYILINRKFWNNRR